MSGIVIVKGSETLKKFKDTGEMTLSKESKTEIKELLKGPDTYIIARLGHLEPLEIPQEEEEVDEEDEVEDPVEVEPEYYEPGEDGYYLQGQVSFEFYEGQFFAKARTIPDGKGKFKRIFEDLITGKEITL